MKRLLEITYRATLDVERIPESDPQFRATIVRTANTLRLSTAEAGELLERGCCLYTALSIHRLVPEGQA